jgi:hypothetical protein
MIFSSKKGFIFCAFNKTGTSSIEKVLERYGDRWGTRRVRKAYEKLDEPAIFKHARPAHLVPLIGADVWERSFTFCFVRNPFDRMVSLYHFHRQLHPERFPLAAETSFLEWAREGGSGTAQRSMREFVCDDDGNQIIDFVGRFESLHEDFARVCERIGIQAELPMVNTSKHKSYVDYYDDESRALVQAWVQPDLDYFGYGFEGAVR